MNSKSKQTLERELESVNKQLMDLQSVIKKTEAVLLQIQSLKTQRANLQAEISRID